MLKSKSLQKGFTIVELLIVIVVIGILAALVLNTVAGVQQRARDTERQTDINNIATQLEVYYNDEGRYPAFANVTAGTLNGLDEGALVAPDQNETSSLTDGRSADKADYGYRTDTEGTYFELTYTKESLGDGESNPISKKSLNGTVPTP